MWSEICTACQESDLAKLSRICIERVAGTRRAVELGFSFNELWSGHISGAHTVRLCNSHLGRLGDVRATALRLEAKTATRSTSKVFVEHAEPTDPLRGHIADANIRVGEKNPPNNKFIGGVGESELVLHECRLVRPTLDITQGDLPNVP